MSITAKTTTARRRGRPRSDNPKNDRRTGCFTQEEGRKLNAWMKKNGITIDNEALRTIILDRLAADGIKDPGEDSYEGQPCTSPWRPPAQITGTTDDQDTLLLTA